MGADERPLAQELAGFAASFRLAEAPRRDELVERVRLHLLDTAGLALAAWTAEDRFGQLLLEGWTGAGGAGDCVVIGAPRRAAAPVAAFLNAALVQGTAFDDVDLLTVMHCEAFATAVTLALAQERASSGAELAEAWIVGAEVALRMASGAGGEGGLFSAGFHNTSIFGTFGAAAAAAKLLGLDAGRTASALALAVSLTSGTSVGWLDGSGRNLPIQAGWAAHGGIVAARLAETGYSCSPRTIDAPRGLYDAHAWKEGWSREPVLERLGEDWRMSRLAFKLYPCGAMIQATAQCVETLVREHGVTADEVESGELRVPAQFGPVIEDMGASLHRPTSGFASIGSFPCVASRILIDGRYGLDHLTDDAVRDPRMLALADRLEVVADDAHLELALDERPVTVTLRTARGELRGQVGRNAGHHLELSRERVVEKFRANAGLVADADRVAVIERAVLGFAELEDAGELAAVLAGDAAP